MKIVGVISDYKEAENIEDIVKVFVVEKRISSLFTENKTKDLVNIESNTMILSSNNDNTLNTPDEETIQKQVNNQKPIFNVRGFN